MAETKATTTNTTNTTNLWSIAEGLDAWKTDPSSIRFVDATWFHKGSRTGRQEFEDGPRLPGAVLWDIHELAASTEFFPRMNPNNLGNVFPPQWFIGRALEATLDRRLEQEPEQLPLDEDDAAIASAKTTLVVYGRNGTLFAPRVWYLLKKYCAPDAFEVRLLQGSLEDWIAAGGPVETEVLPDGFLRAKDLVEKHQEERNPGDGEDDGEDHDVGHPLVSMAARDRIVDKEFVLKLLETGENDSDTSNDGELLPRTIIDTRGVSFKDGHIPGSVHIPYASLSLPDDSLTLKPPDQLLEVLKETLGEARLEDLRTRPPLLTCGSAVSVCTLALALDELGFPEPWIYDGSYQEWGKDPSTPKVSSEEEK